MSDKRKQSGGKEIRRIKLDDDQYQKARALIAARESAAKLLGQAMSEALSKMAEDEAVLWDQLRRVAGIEGDNDSFLSVEWITRELVVRQREDDGDES